ncbi:hybrid sensor histidine kinase/response regulator [Nocardioides sp. URHA0020]|uniref:hybrid sensor histidine kinase/response regulator n=1 Tax=Nocardioides sp. URHA0020 TaxID=1380392 RepID=UPI0006861264|nr:response regulator [Nocardioides sp. URHA0020]
MGRRGHGDDRSREALVDELERRTRELAEAQSIAKIGSWEFSSSDRVLRWSDELFRLLDLEPGTVQPTADSLFERLHPDDREIVEAAYAAMAGDGAPMAFDARLRPVEGQPTRWVRVRGRAVMTASGEMLRAAGTVQDITESKEAEQGLAFLSAMAAAANEAPTLSEALLAADTIVRPFTQWPAIIVSAPDPEDPDVLVHFDAGWRDYGPEDLAFARTMAEEVAVRREMIERVGPSGTVLVAGPALVRDRMACVVVSDSRAVDAPRAYERAIFMQMLALLATVAQREEVSAELATARDEALAASRAKSEFLATMSHEIRTPLNGVIGLSELLSRTELTTHQRRFADGIDQAGRTLLGLVNDILDLSKVEAGKLDLEEVDFDPRDVIERSVELVSDSASGKDLELAISSVDQMPALVRGDPVRFGQVITNLVSNAVKFTDNGEVVVRASGTGGSGVRIEVSDTGIGIAPEVLGRLFTAFSQADSSTTRRFGGTGLGLAISERIVTAMGGEIGVESTAGEGSTFWFTAPFKPAAGAGTPAMREGAVAGLRVLVVDDNATNRFILAEQLRAWDVDVTVAASAHEALGELDGSLRRPDGYDVVLLDYMMPGIDGEQLARAIRSDERLRELRLALLSSALEPAPGWLESAGIDTYVSKPVLASRLLDELAVLGGRFDASRPARPTVPVPPPDGVRGRVLVVEDNAVNQLVATGMLHHLGCAVVIAEDGAQAVAAIADAPAGFDAVLMDCQMPVMDGFDATRAIRAMGGPPGEVPIIAMTASATAEERERCREAGMDDFLPKPVDAELLASTLDKWLPGRQGTPARAPTLLGAPSAADARIRELVEDGFDAELVLRIVDRFDSGAHQTLTELAAAASAGDAVTTADRAHRLRGSADNIGLRSLGARCLEIELRAHEGGVPSPEEVGDLRAAVAEAVADLTEASDWLR